MKAVSCLRRFRRPASLLVAATAAAFVVACASPPKEVHTRALTAAQVIAPPPGRARLVIASDADPTSQRWQGFECLDGVDVRDKFNTPTGLVVAPGRHYLTVSAHLLGAVGHERIWLDAAPGHLYELGYQAEAANERHARAVFLSVLSDHATGKRVGGLTGGETPVFNEPSRCNYLHQEVMSDVFTATPYDLGYRPPPQPLRSPANALLVGLDAQCITYIPMHGESLDFSAVDGVNTVALPFRVLSLSRYRCTYPPQLEVPAGRHRVRVFYHPAWSGADDQSDVDVVLEPGATYDVKRVIEGYDIRYAVVRHR